MKTKPTKPARKISGGMPFENNDEPTDMDREFDRAADGAALMNELGIKLVDGHWVSPNQSLSKVAQKKTGSLSKLPAQKPKKKKGALE